MYIIRSVSMFLNSFFIDNRIIFLKFIIPWTRGHPFPCQKSDDTAQWIARVWWNCDYENTSRFNKTGYYYLPMIPIKEQAWQQFIDAIHTVCFVLGGTVGGMTAKYWYIYLTR